MKTSKALLTIGSMIGARRAVRAIRDLELDDVLGVAGLQRRVDWPERLATTAVVAVVSAAVGAGVALLLTPYSGDELRRRIGSQAKEMKDKATNKAQELQHEWKAEKPLHNS